MCWICAGYETYICDMCCKLWDLIKNRQYAGSLPSATDGKGFLCHQQRMAKGSLPSAADGKEATWQATVLPGRLTNLVSLPTVADGIGFAVRSG